MNDNLTNIILATIPLIGAVLTGILIPLIKENMSEKQLERVTFWAEIAAVAIEKHYEGEIGAGRLKKAYVMEFLINNLKFDKYVSEEQLSLIVDAVVEQLINMPEKELKEEQ